MDLQLKIVYYVVYKHPSYHNLTHDEYLNCALIFGLSQELYMPILHKLKLFLLNHNHYFQKDKDFSPL